MLDKLAANAVEFSAKDSTIRFELRREESGASLSVSNAGPPLPARHAGPVIRVDGFDTRRAGASEPHLGLGLYIVRLIAGFHDAHATARNRDDGSGVEVRIDFPLANTSIT